MNRLRDIFANLFVIKVTVRCVEGCANVLFDSIFNITKVTVWTTTLNQVCRIDLI